MRKYLTYISIILFSYLVWDYIFYYNGDIYISNSEEVQTFSKAEDKKLWIDDEDGFEVFDLKGVNIGLGVPGKYPTEYAITKEEYLRWFEQIQDLGANTIRIYTIAHEEFYDAFYEYNYNNSDPLFLIHGVWVDEYLLNSHRDAFDDEFYNNFLNNSKDVVDVIHGRHKISKLYQAGSQNYKKDISPWVYGYIIGVEWDPAIVSFTNETGQQLQQFTGEYLYTDQASNFEIFLAMVGDEMIDYETDKYGSQRTLAFSNWPPTDPFSYNETVNFEFEKHAPINVDTIKSSENFLSGQYATYHAYPYYPEYLYFVDDSIENTYLAYLEQLVEHHKMPVVISEYGVPSSRGIAAYEENRQLGRDQGRMSEKEQGQALVSMSEDIKKSGAAGGAVFVWHDEWFKRTWNTVPFTDLDFTAYWSDYQTNEQYFGLLSFDPGEEQSVVYVDGDKSEWSKDDVVVSTGDYQLSMNYDEKFIYFLAEKENIDFDKERLYIPIDLTPKSGSHYMDQYQLNMSSPTDFIIEIDTEENSRVWVQERYNATRIIEGRRLHRYDDEFENPVPKDSSKFEEIEMVLHEFYYFDDQAEIPFSKVDFADTSHYSLSQTYETGKLTYGNANPKADDFNSLGDFYFGSNFVEIKIPWRLLNFSDPVEMKIHDDYYENYGVEPLKIDHLNVGVGGTSAEIKMEKFPLKRLGRRPQYHERLKESYYILQEYWTAE